VFRLINNTKWEKDLVLCLNDKAVLCGQWTPNGQKFAIGTSCHRCFVGYYEDKNNWWQSEKISGFKSSVISVSWHPSGRVLGIGSSDNSLSLISAVI
jgi:actin related protein 2/3 complex subunit 1A/1B